MYVLEFTYAHIVCNAWQGLVAKDKLHVSYHGQALNKSMAEVCLQTKIFECFYDGLVLPLQQKIPKKRDLISWYLLDMV